MPLPWDKASSLRTKQWVNIKKLHVEFAMHQGLSWTLTMHAPSYLVLSTILWHGCDCPCFTARLVMLPPSFRWWVGIQDSRSGPADPTPALSVLSHPRHNFLKRLHLHNSQLEFPGKPNQSRFFIVGQFSGNQAGNSHKEKHVEQTVLPVDRWQPPWFEGN